MGLSKPLLDSVLKRDVCVEQAPGTRHDSDGSKITM